MMVECLPSGRSRLSKGGERLFPKTVTPPGPVSLFFLGPVELLTSPDGPVKVSMSSQGGTIFLSV